MHPRKIPAPEMMRRPREWIETDPRPAERPQRDPPPVVVRTPIRGDARIPHVAVRRLVLPRPILIEGAGIRPHLVGQILRRDAEPLIAAGFRPPIECVPRSGVVRIR